MVGFVASAVEFFTLPISQNKKSVDLKFRSQHFLKIKVLGSFIIFNIQYMSMTLIAHMSNYTLKKRKWYCSLAKDGE